MHATARNIFSSDMCLCVRLFLTNSTCGGNFFWYFWWKWICLHDLEHYFFSNGLKWSSWLLCDTRNQILVILEAFWWFDGRMKLMSKFKILWLNWCQIFSGSNWCQLQNVRNKKNIYSFFVEEIGNPCLLMSFLDCSFLFLGGKMVTLVCALVLFSHF